MFNNLRKLEADNGSKGGAPNTDPTPEPNTEPKPKIEFTPEQQSHIQGLIDAQYARAAAKFEKDYSKKLTDIQEAEKLKNMSADERQKAELEAAQRKIVEFERKELLSQFKLELAGKQLPSELADYLDIKDADTAKKAVDFFSGYTST